MFRSLKPTDATLQRLNEQRRTQAERKRGEKVTIRFPFSRQVSRLPKAPSGGEKIHIRWKKKPSNPERWKKRHRFIAVFSMVWG